MFKFKLCSIIRSGFIYCAVASGGVWFGSYLQDRRNASTTPTTGDYELSWYRRNLPGCPVFSTVSAATKFPSHEIEDRIQPYETPATSVSSFRTSQIMKYGFPSLENVRVYEDFVLSYDQRNRMARWTFEHLTSDKLKYNKNIDRTKCAFQEDKSVHPFFRSTNADYKGSGYDRGHLAAAGNHRISQEHVNQTFYLSNIAPQVGPGFNRHIWNDLEKYVRKLARSYANVYVCTGPLFLPKKESDGKMYVRYEVIGPNRVAVPTHFFKIVVMESQTGDLEMESFVMPNKPIQDNTPIHSFQVPPESIERAAGLLFFNKISREKLIKINGRKSTYV